MCEPWFNIPLVTEWTTTTDGGATIIQATNIEQVRTPIRDIPSVVGSSPDIISAMNQYDQYVSEREQEEYNKVKQ